MTYPLGLSLAGRRVLVVGGGPVAARRLDALVAEKADVHVVSPEVVESIARLHDRGYVAWRRGVFDVADLDGAWLVFAHTSDPDTQDAVAREAERRGTFCVKGGDPEGATAHVPAVARFHGVTVGVNASRDPKRAAAIAALIQAELETGELPSEPRREGPPTTSHQPAGTVALVGGGPGETGLLTVRGRFLLASADVVVADRLGPRKILDRLPETARIIEVGKRPGGHSVTQDEINEILVREAHKGHRVVRLKGGDPFVLGRGGEETEYCARHGVATEVVPGVTSAISVPAAAGIPVTHRGVATGFTVVTGHRQIDAIPEREDHTIILLMGVAQLARTAERILGTGRSASTPVAIVESGWTENQRTTFGRLDDIAETADRVGVRSPAVIVVGDVVRLAPDCPDASRRILPSVSVDLHG